MANCSNSYKPSGFDEVLTTSDISIYDGNALQCVNLTGSPTLNQVLSAIDQAICSAKSTVPAHSHNGTDVSYKGTTNFACFTVTGTDVETVIEEVATQLCTLSSTVVGTGDG